MSLSRQDQIDTVLKKILEVHNKNEKQNQNAQAEYNSQVSSLQAQNFFRRNKPNIIYASTTTLSAAISAISIYGLIDGFSLPEGEVPNPYFQREVIDIAGGIAGISFGVISLVCSISFWAIHLRQGSGCSPCCDPMPELAIPASTLIEKNKLSDHFISEQCASLIYLCMQMMDIMDSKLETKDKKQFQFFYPKIEAKLNTDLTNQFQDPCQYRMEELQKTLTLKEAIEVIQKFKTFMEKNNLSTKNNALLSKRLNNCMPFCQEHQAHNESTPLLGIQVQQ